MGFAGSFTCGRSDATGDNHISILPEKGDIAPADLRGMNLNLRPPCHRGIPLDLQPECACTLMFQLPPSVQVVSFRVQFEKHSELDFWLHAQYISHAIALHGQLGSKNTKSLVRERRMYRHLNPATSPTLPLGAETILYHTVSLVSLATTATGTCSGI